MPDQQPTWQQIAKELAKESNPAKRRKLQRNLRQALERAGFQNYATAKESDRKRLDENFKED
jgi:hypothetical protein